MPSTAQAKPTTDKRRILLVDDDVEIIESMEATFTMKGFEVLIARDGNQGLAMAEQSNPSIAILDMMMPKRSGFLVLERLREFELKRAGFQWSAPSDFYVLLKLLSHIQESGSQRKQWWGLLAAGSPECVADRTAVDAAPELMRVIMITANEGERHRRYAKEHLAVDVYLRKPKFSMEQLLETVETLLADAK
jgi:DNA-binding response OmpR family regulator